MSDPLGVPPADSEPLPLELTCFGPPTARLAGRAPPPDVLWRKHLALLVYLALSPGRTRTRAHLLGVLWPESDEARARHSLNEALRRLRLSLGPARLHSQGEMVSLDCRSLEVDALRFEALALRDPRRAAAVPQGDFLEGFALEDAPAFEEWAARERERYRSELAAALVADGRKALDGARPADALAAARRALALEPYAEPAVRLAMGAAALARDTAGAMKAYRDFCDRLDEIGERPGRDLAALADRIRGQRWQVQQGPATGAAPPLVGRAGALATVAPLIRQVLAGEARILLVTGPPGTGKTRLMNHCLECVALEGGVAGAARPLESDQDAPWSTLRSLVRSGLLSAPGFPAADPHALAVLASCVPELAGRVGPRPPEDRAQVGAAVASLLGAIAGEAPLAIGLDEAHLADRGTIGALHAAMAQLRSGPVLLVVASAPADRGFPAELLHLIREVGGELPGAAVELGPLSLEDLAELVGGLAPWCQSEPERARLTRRVAFETGGNPFLAVTMLRGLADLALLRDDALEWPAAHATLESPLPFILPDLVRRAIAARLIALERDTAAVLAAASIGAVALDLELIAALTGMDARGLEPHLALLERQHFITFDAGRYAFAAPLVQQVVRNEALTPGEAQGLRLRAIAALASRNDLESRALRVELMARAMATAQAFGEAIALARDARAAESGRIAGRALLAADRIAAADPRCDRREVEALRTAPG